MLLQRNLRLIVIVIIITHYNEIIHICNLNIVKQTLNNLIWSVIFKVEESTDVILTTFIEIVKTLINDNSLYQLFGHLNFLNSSTNFIQNVRNYIKIYINQIEINKYELNGGYVKLSYIYRNTSITL